MKTGKNIRRVRVIDRGLWAVIRVPLELLTSTQRQQLANYLRSLPLSDRRYSGAIEAWCVASVWLEPVVELIENLTGQKVAIEG
jgi:hypothetical protein